ncbi:MAG TPA: YceI family protein [Geopsychrobacteraceae bacterium]|nr:YceI family protein [Geopsychrobacteraceae bacterium]
MKILIVVALFVALPFSALAVDYQGHCSVLFQGSSTLHDFDGKGSCQPFTVTENSGRMTIPELKVSVADMDTDNSKRDKKMFQMFEAEKYPVITGNTGAVVLDSFRSKLKERNDSAADIVIDLKIRDIEKPVTAQLKNVNETSSEISADLVFQVSLSDYQLEPPSVLGIIRVGDVVNVTVSLLLKAQ